MCLPPGEAILCPDNQITEPTLQNDLALEKVSNIKSMVDRKSYNSMLLRAEFDFKVLPVPILNAAYYSMSCYEAGGHIRCIYSLQDWKGVEQQVR